MFAKVCIRAKLTMRQECFYLDRSKKLVDSTLITRRQARRWRGKTCRVGNCRRITRLFIILIHLRRILTGASLGSNLSGYWRFSVLPLPTAGNATEAKFVRIPFTLKSFADTAPTFRSRTITSTRLLAACQTGSIYSGNQIWLGEVAFLTRTGGSHVRSSV